MTPCIKMLKKAKVTYTIQQYQHDTTCESYGEEAAQKLGVIQERVFKTLVVQSEDTLFVAVVPVSSKLSLKELAKVVGVKKIAMADAKIVEKSTGYVLGGVSPFGQKKRLVTVVDKSALEYETIFVSAGKRGLDVEISPQIFPKLIPCRFEEIENS